MKKEELTDLFMKFVEDQFPELIEEEKEKTGFSDGDQFYCISFDGKVNDDYWSDHQVDRERLSIGNAFKTEEEAKFAVEKLKVIHELEALGRPFKYCRDNCYIAFDADDGDIIFFHNNNYQSKYCNCYFDSEDEAREAVKKIGEDRIKRYLFGVEE